MSATVIRVENVSKKCVIKHASGHASGDGLRHAVQNALALKLPFSKLV
jgi:hypothetical protein